MNPLRWVLWKISQRLWDYSYFHNHTNLCYYASLGLLKYGPDSTLQMEVRK